MRREQLETPHGRCVLVTLDDGELPAALAALPADEQAFAGGLSEIRRRDFVAGRTALHLAIDDFAPAILAGQRGAPVLPAGWVGSVSHKGTTAAAIVATADTGWIGIDVERAAPPRVDIGRRILTAREQAALSGSDHDRGRAVTLRFAIKEAIYKAVDPIVARYVGFTEVELEVGERYCAVTSELPAAIEATWVEHGSHWIATARAVRR
jgi:4'-phosphopantetheinyl transferase EntD